VPDKVNDRERKCQHPRKALKNAKALAADSSLEPYSPKLSRSRLQRRRGAVLNGYTKLFSSIVTSTIWQESAPTKVVWVTMLAMADTSGEIQSSVPGLAHIAQVSVGDTEAALAKFLAPDKYSRTPDFDGRRIEPIDGGWRLLNHGKYRYMLSEGDRKERDRERKRRYRGRHQALCPTENGTERDKAGQDGNVREIQHTDTKAEALKDISSNAPASDQSDLLDSLRKVWDYYIHKVGRDPRTYSFTPIRQRIGLKRLEECLAKTDGDLENAENLMRIAIDQLAASDWHMGRDPKTNGKKYCEWDRHLFKTYEQMERWWN
jgi:hypothetical protein